MKFTILELLSNIELNDFKIESISLDVKNKEFRLILEGAYWFENSVSKPKVMENGGVIKVHNYSSFEARYFLPKDKLWCTLDYENLEIIDEINEKSYENSVLKLAGFGKRNGYWIEYLIRGGEFEISFKE
jgi:hypothetical protein